MSKPPWENYAEESTGGQPWEKFAEAPEEPEGGAVNYMRGLAADRGKYDKFKTGPLEYVGGAVSDVTRGATQGLPGMIAGGVTGLGQLGLNKLGMVDDNQYGDTVHGVQDFISPPPMTKGGMDIMSLAQIPLQWWLGKSDDAGGRATDQYESPGRGTMVRSAIEGAPMIAASAVGAGSMVRGALRRPEPPRPRVDPGMRTEPTLPPDMGPTIEPRPAQPATVSPAQAMAEKAGIPWDQLSTNMKRRVTEIAKDAVDFEAVDPEQLARIMRAESLPVPITLRKGQVTRDPQQMRNEDVAAAGGSPDAQPIRDQMTQFNRAVAANLAELKVRTGAKVKPGGIIPSEQAGQRVAASLEQKERRSNTKVTRAYNTANNSPEAQMTVDAKPLIDWLVDVKPDSGVALSINAFRDRMAGEPYNLIKVDPETGAITKLRDPTMYEMERLRQSTQSYKQGPDGVFMGRLRGEIDAATAKGGGDLYKGARAERIRHRKEHEDPASVANLLALKKGNTDRKVALEKVWSTTVLNGSLQTLRNTKNALLKLEADDLNIRRNGRDAWKEMAGATIDFIEGETIGKIVAKGYGGESVASTASLKRALDKIGDEKLDILLGEGQRKQLRQMEQVLRDQEIPPFKGSPTAPFLLAWLEKSFDLLGNAAGAVGGLSTKIMMTGAKEVVKGAMHKGQSATSAKGAVLTDTAFPVARANSFGRKERVQTGPSLSAVDRIPPKAKRKSKAPSKFVSGRSRVSPLIPLSQIGLPPADQERRMAPFYAQGLSIDRDRTDSSGRVR